MTKGPDPKDKALHSTIGELARDHVSSQTNAVIRDMAKAGKKWRTDNTPVYTTVAGIAFSVVEKHTLIS